MCLLAHCWQRKEMEKGTDEQEEGKDLREISNAALPETPPSPSFSLLQEHFSTSSLTFSFLCFHFYNML